MRSIVVPVLASVVLVAGCSRRSEAPSTASEKPPSSAAAPAKNVVPESPQPALATVSGKVLETIDASDYTYMRLSTSAGEMWAAVTKADVKKGDEVTVVNAMTMDGFESRTLKRKFDRIVFGNLAPPGGTRTAEMAAQQPPGVAPAPMASGHQSSGSPTREEMAAQHGQAAGGPESVPDVKVEKAAGPNAKTVAELWKERAALKGKQVTLKAKVVKVTPGVMGRNWLHVRDGSGSKATKDNDLAVTTEATARVGEVVTLTGLVSVDKDFGAGYAYPVIVEDAKLAK